MSMTLLTFVATLTWSQPETLGNPPSPRHGHVMVAAGTQLFIHGGLAGDTFFDDLHCIDISKEGRGRGDLCASLFFLIRFERIQLCFEV
jgi:hypothetical protein